MAARAQSPGTLSDVPTQRTKQPAGAPQSRSPSLSPLSPGRVLDAIKRAQANWGDKCPDEDPAAPVQSSPSSTLAPNSLGTQATPPS